VITYLDNAMQEETAKTAQSWVFGNAILPLFWMERTRPHTRFLFLFHQPSFLESFQIGTGPRKRTFGTTVAGFFIYMLSPKQQRQRPRYLL